MEQKRILIVDDEQDLCDILHFNLVAAGYQADVASSAEEALSFVHSSQFIVHSYDLLLLDVMMPGLSGFELAERLKADAATAHIPIIFLTAKDAEDDTLQGFRLGADDYVTKPFSVREVLARVAAVLKRSHPQAGEAEKILRYGDLEVDTVAKTATIGGTAVALTRTEFDLLCLLLRHQGQVFSRPQLLGSVWPDDVIVTDRTVDVNITRLRKKLGRYASCIVTRQGFGYLWE